MATSGGSRRGGASSWTPWEMRGLSRSTQEDNSSRSLQPGSSRSSQPGPSHATQPDSSRSLQPTSSDVDKHRLEEAAEMLRCAGYSVHRDVRSPHTTHSESSSVPSSTLKRPHDSGLMQQDHVVVPPTSVERSHSRRRGPTKLRPVPSYQDHRKVLQLHPMGGIFRDSGNYYASRLVQDIWHHVIRSPISSFGELSAAECEQLWKEFNLCFKFDYTTGTLEDFYRVWKSIMTEKIPHMFYRERQPVLNEDLNVNLDTKVPQWADPEAWAVICKQWEDLTGTFNRLSRFDRENRKKPGVVHSTGYKGFEGSSAEMSRQNGGVTPPFPMIYFHMHSQEVHTPNGLERQWNSPDARKPIMRYEEAIKAKYPKGTKMPWFDGDVWHDIIRKEEGRTRKILGWSPLTGKRPVKGSKAGPSSSGVSPVMTNQEMTDIINHAVQERVDGVIQQQVDSLKKKLMDVLNVAGIHGGLDGFMTSTTPESNSAPSSSFDKRTNVDDSNMEQNSLPLEEETWGMYDDFP